MSKQKNKSYDKTSKGFIFSLDAVFSVFVLIVLVASFSFLSARSYPQSLPQVGLQTKTNDMVVILDKLGYISAMDGQNISDYVDNTLGSNIGWKIGVEYYNYTGGTNGSFVLDTSLILGENTTSDNLASATRIFVVQENGSVIHYGNILMTAWYD